MTKRKRRQIILSFLAWIVCIVMFFVAFQKTQSLGYNHEGRNIAAEQDRVNLFHRQQLENAQIDHNRFVPGSLKKVFFHLRGHSNKREIQSVVD